ncbi:MAG: hypothetical protein AB7I18_10345 [Candidatus Berkiella sp.]
MIKGTEKDKSKKKQEPDTSIWKGKIMPTILRGSTEHNKKVREESSQRKLQMQQNSERGHVVASTAQQPAVKKDTMRHVKEIDALFKRAEQLIEGFSVLATPKQEIVTKDASNVGEQVPKSQFHCDETLDDLPHTPEAPTVLVRSPFSKAKAKAARLKVGLSEECRGMYEIDELHRRIDYLASLRPKK